MLDQIVVSYTNFFFLETFVRKIHNLGLEIHILGKLKEKIDILSTHKLLPGKFAAVCRKIDNFLPPKLSLTHDAGGQITCSLTTRPPRFNIISYTILYTHSSRVY